MTRFPLSLLAFAIAFTAASAQPARTNLLLITLDTVRADRIGAYGYGRAATPALDRLAREGVRFADATTQSPLTGPAHTAILTGVYPARFGVRDNATTPIPDQAVTLGELLKTAGYRTGGFIGAFVLGREYGFAQGLDEFDDRFDAFDASMKLQAQRRGGAVVDAAVRWISAKAADQPFFAWVHLYDAHAPYAAPPPFAATYRARPYDGEIAYVDACVARLVSLLERQGQLDRTLVVAMADHGEGLGDHGEGEHGLFLYEPVLHIPWIMRLPGRASAGRVVEEQVRSIDLVPTIAELLGTKAPAGLDGESLVSVIKGIARRDPPASYAETYYPKLHYGWSELRSLRADQWKYIDAPRPELYHVGTDPAERTNAIASRAPLAGGLLAALNRLHTGFGRLASAPAVPPDPETLARLRSLGYIGIATPTGSTARGPDPKDMAAQMREANETLSRAMDDLGAGRLDAALAQLRQLIAINDRWYDVHLLIGDAYLAKRDIEGALGEYATAAVLNPASAAPVLSAARALIAQGAIDRALQKIDEAALLEPSSSEVPLERGRAYERLGQNDKALAEYQTAVRSNAADPRPRARLADLALRSRRLDVAEGEFRALLAMNYRPAETHYGLGRVAQLRGNHTIAAAEYRRAISLNPSLTDAKAALAALDPPARK